MIDTLTLQRPRRFTGSSSRQVEELPVASGLAPQASIAGCLASRGRPEEWGASLERLGQEHSRVEELGSYFPALLEKRFLEDLASAVLESVWIGELDPSRGRRECVFLTSAHHGFSGASGPGMVYLVQLKRTDSAGEAGTPEECASESGEPVLADTERAYTVQQMAQGWDAIGKQVTEDDVPLSVDPDDYPLF